MKTETINIYYSNGGAYERILVQMPEVWIPQNVQNSGRYESDQFPRILQKV